MENSASSFAHRFEVERDALDGGGAPLLAKVYPAPNFPSTPDWWDALFASAAQSRKQAAGANQADLVMADFEGPDYLEDSQHSEATIPWEDRYRIYCWIDANVPFYSHYEQLSPTMLSEPARQELQGLYQRRCAACHEQRPRQDAITWLSPFSIWVHTGPQPGQWGISESGLRVRHLNLTQPEHSLALQAPLAAAAGGT
jgi:hypothetical protein